MQRTSSDSDSDSDSEGSNYYTAAECRALEELIKKKLRQYAHTKKRGEAEVLLREILVLMRDLAAHHPTLEDRTRWAAKTDELEKAPDGEKEHILMDIGKGLGLIIALPFLIAGGVLYGVGLFVKGLGNILTGGFMKDAVEQ